MDSVAVVVCICVGKSFCILEPRKVFRPDIFFFEGFAE